MDNSWYSYKESTIWLRLPTFFEKDSCVLCIVHPKAHMISVTRQTLYVTNQRLKQGFIKNTLALTWSPHGPYTSLCESPDPSLQIAALPGTHSTEITSTHSTRKTNTRSTGKTSTHSTHLTPRETRQKSINCCPPRYT